jgi:hypothetical protein
MAERRISEAKKIGDGFYKKNFGRGIKSRTNLILKISIIVIALEIIDEIPIILDIYKEGLESVIFSVVEIVCPIILGIIIFMLIKELDKWENTYKKVKSLID